MSLLSEENLYFKKMLANARIYLDYIKLYFMYKNKNYVPGVKIPHPSLFTAPRIRP